MKHINEIIEEGMHKFLVNSKAAKTNKTCDIITTNKTYSFPVIDEKAFRISVLITFDLNAVDKEELDEALARAMEITMTNDGKKIWHMKDVSNLNANKVDDTYVVNAFSYFRIEKFN